MSSSSQTAWGGRTALGGGPRVPVHGAEFQPGTLTVMTHLTKREKGLASLTPIAVTLCLILEAVLAG